ncbi:radical SAM family heme chaperone HemW [Scatolibacter rhodanostii]|uniref:radical SAM family heme chaperone HemW n=1 Tax=Scatolibacter rhodanostii TaxID=2014781 RepID=UPI000C080996|nr:radical SAM family heme chaperone HemW [Scatolibacter rhodanostii]
MIKHPPLGIYIHVPFCSQKCPYCDFYSLPPKGNLAAEYIHALQVAMQKYAHLGLSVDTVYFGGGTPSLLGAENLVRILTIVKENFAVSEQAEITCEANPGNLSNSFFAKLKQGGFNRLSFGMQSANETELRCLGRQHSADDVKKAVQSAQEFGFDNISVDLMLGIPESSAEHLRESMNFVGELNIQHVSAYMLKIEENTPFYTKRETLTVPDDDGMADLYQLCTDTLPAKGFAQYEISNFAKLGFESRHNLKYWHCEEYLGFGPSAHSFYEGNRFYYPRSVNHFLAGKAPLSDGTGGDFEEFAMLNLRLREGISRSACEEHFDDGKAQFNVLLANVKKCPPHLLLANPQRIALTPAGFAVSNAVILTLLS